MDVSRDGLDSIGKNRPGATCHFEFFFVCVINIYLPPSFLSLSLFLFFLLFGLLFQFLLSLTLLLCCLLLHLSYCVCVCCYRYTQSLNRTPCVDVVAGD